MMEPSLHWFEQGLGARIDALEVALKSLQTEAEPDIATVRNLARSLTGPALLHGYDAINRAASAVQAAPDSAMSDGVRTLIDVLRREAAKTKQAQTTILIVGGDPGFNETLSDDISAPSRSIACVDTAAAAEELLGRQHVSFIVLNLFLPDIDGRAFLLKLREKPVTTAIPVLILAPELSDTVRAEARIIDADILIESPPDTAMVRDRINARLRRAHESAKSARRDPLTGLLNRAAFREAFNQTVRETSKADDPLAMALIAVDSPRASLDSHGDQFRNTALQQIGSLISNSLRSTDIVARWGVCEFAALFPGEDQFGGARAVEKLVTAVRNENFRDKAGHSVRVTLSAGVTPVVADTAIDNAMSDADRFLFQAAAAGGDQVTSSQSPTPARTERVLLLIADEITARVMEHLLERDGFKVTRIPQVDGPVTSELGSQKLHLVVIDQNVPSRGGLDVLKELRSLPEYNRTPIVMLLDRNSEGGMAHSLELGANDYVMRPFSPFTFIRRMRRLLRRSVATATQPHIGGEICSILVIDNEIKSLLIAASALHEKGGFLPCLAMGPIDGRQRLADVSPDVILLNADLDGHEGQEFVRMVLRNTTPETAAVILATAQTDAGATEHLSGAALRGTIRKPFDALTLGQQVEEALNMSPSPRQPDNAADHLNKEIQRILADGS